MANEQEDLKQNKSEGKNAALSIPVQRAEARGAEVCAEHLDTRLGFVPALLGFPKSRKYRNKNTDRKSVENYDDLIQAMRRQGPLHLSSCKPIISSIIF